MATKYVECSRKTGMNDTQTIQAAIEALKDGDTLVFNKKTEIKDESTGAVIGYDTTYVLDAPVDFTRCNVGNDETPEIVNKTRKYLTINGNGCTVCWSNDYISNYKTIIDNTSEENKENRKAKKKEALFYLSDAAKNGLKHCTIKNFIFTWDKSNSSVPVEFENRNYGMGVVPTDPNITSDEGKSMYFSFGTIENCEFHRFETGVYMCGENVDIRQCYFYTCDTGINSDGTEQLNVYNNYFYTTLHQGLRLNTSYRSNAYGNVFWGCGNSSISVEGPQNNRNDLKYLTVNIYANKIFGSNDPDSEGVRNERGIQCNGIKDVVIRDNFIKDISYVSNDQEKEYDKDGQYGMGILLTGNNSTDNERISERVIVADNIITGSRRYGIGVNFSSSCIISGNSIHSMGKENANDYGIYIGNKAGNLSIAGNKLYNFEYDKFIYSGDNNKYNMSIVDNTYYGRNLKFNPLSPARIISNTFNHPDNTMHICIPSLDTPLENNEEIMLYVPVDYQSSTVSYISYDNMVGAVMDKNNSMQINVKQNRGEYLHLKYKYINHPSGDYIRFIMCE
ncbi:MAG: hypothetical protein E7578_08025 [Ruminococcaceae bacterium]|nr:hypothetical protein [Oscillospiraceae bacterium]